MRFLKLRHAALLVPLLAPASFAQPAAEAQNARDFFDLADTDGDGRLDAAEYARVDPGFSFEEVAGGDGAVEPDEYRAAFNDNVQGTPSGLDLYDDNGDGYIDKQEYEDVGFQASLGAVDLNDDQRVSGPELALALAGAAESGTNASDAADGQPAGQADAESQTLEARVRARPQRFTGRPLKSRDGDTVATVEDFVVSRQGEQLYALVTLQSGSAQDDTSAVRISELESDGDTLVYPHRNAARRLANRNYFPDRYEPLSTPQTNPEDAVEDASLEQIARSEPDSLEGQALHDDQGERIGRIEAILLQRDEDQLYALLQATEVSMDDARVIRVKHLDQREGMLIAPTDRIGRPDNADNYLRLEDTDSALD